jgi:hypothetical protein
VGLEDLHVTGTTKFATWGSLLYTCAYQHRSRGESE